MDEVMSFHRRSMADPTSHFNQFISDGQSYVTLLISIWDRRWSNTNVEEDVKYVSYYVLDSQSNQFNKEFIQISPRPTSGLTSGPLLLPLQIPENYGPVLGPDCPIDPESISFNE